MPEVEYAQLDDDPSGPGIFHHLAKVIEVSLVEPGQIKPGPAIGRQSPDRCVRREPWYLRTAVRR